MKESPQTYVDRISGTADLWYAILDGIPVRADFTSKGAAEAGIEVERRRRAEACAPRPEKPPADPIPELIGTTPHPWHVSQIGITKDRMCKIFYLAGKPDGQGNPVWGDAVDDARLIESAPKLRAEVARLRELCTASHEAIDILLAKLIAVTANMQMPFLPSRSGQPWETIKQLAEFAKR